MKTAGGKTQQLPFLSSLPLTPQRCLFWVQRISSSAPTGNHYLCWQTVCFCSLSFRTVGGEPWVEHNCFLGAFASRSSPWNYPLSSFLPLKAQQGSRLFQEILQDFSDDQVQPASLSQLISPTPSVSHCLALKQMLLVPCLSSTAALASTCHTATYPLISGTCHTIGLKGFLAQRRVRSMSVLSLDEPGI